MSAEDEQVDQIENQLDSPLITNDEPSRISFTHQISEKEDCDDEDEDLELNRAAKEQVYSIDHRQQYNEEEEKGVCFECYNAIWNHDADSIERIVWWILVITLTLLALGSTAISVASTVCFIRSWHDKRHWWPDSLATNHLEEKLCPISIFHWKGWTERRLGLATIFIIFAIFSCICYNMLYIKITGRFRERRLEHAYPWLSRLIDSATDSADVDGRKALLKARASQKRQQAVSKFQKAFSDRMMEVHDSTLSVELSFKDMCVDGGGKRLLHNICGGVRASRVTAFMGPSGAGKSTLLHALCGKIEVASGEVLVNGTKGSMREMKKLVGFVPQDDILLGMLTVKETLRFHAHLRLPIHVKTHTREAWIDNCIDLLGLTDVKHSIVGDANNRGISGGQRKRVNIGVELVSDPSILFLDEPTSGLDSSAALEVMKCLQIAASEGMTICCVIHQPRTSVFELFDDLLLLGRTSARYGGRTVYYGPADQTTSYFENLNFQFPVKENPADVFIDIVSGSKQPGAPPPLIEDSRQGADDEASRDSMIRDSEQSFDASVPMMRPLADIWEDFYRNHGSKFVEDIPSTHHRIQPYKPDTPVIHERDSEDDSASLVQDLGEIGSTHLKTRRKSTTASRVTRSLTNDTARAYRTMESALANLSVRLQDHQGRNTPSYPVQLLLFLDRQVTQLCRRAPLILKNMIMFSMAGIILGALYADTLSSWPDGGGGYCPASDDDDAQASDVSHCGRQGDDDPDVQPHLAEGDCLRRVWKAVESDMDVTYRQVFTLALLGMALLAVQSSLELFGEERAIFRRESRHHYAWTYACGKMAATMPLSFLYPFCFTAAFHTLFNPMGTFTDYYWTFMAVGVASEGLGMLLSIAFPDTRQVAGGVFALVMAMFTGCFPLFSDGGSTRSVGFFSFLRYGAQLLFRFEYLSYVGLVTQFGCVKQGTYECESSCLKPKGFDRNSFWLPPDASSEYNTTFKECPLPWDYYGEYGNETISINDDDDFTKKHNDDDQWDFQCCSVNLYFKIKDLMKENYGYTMHPDYSFLKLILFSLVFRFLGILILAWKDLAKRR